MNRNEAIELLERGIANPTLGLPQELFYFVSRITPLINVDLLIKNERGQTLLTWRADNYGPPGWHVPGGIIRYKETMADRIGAVARNELNTDVRFDPAPLAINEIILERRDRGHFISLLFRCSLAGELDEKRRCADPSLPGPDEWLWHDACPNNIIPVHDNIYRRFI